MQLQTNENDTTNSRFPTEIAVEKLPEVFSVAEAVMAVRMHPVVGKFGDSSCNDQGVGGDTKIEASVKCGCVG